MAIRTITPPDPFITLDEAKLHLNVDHSDDDALIKSYIAAACAHIDGPFGWLQRAVGEQTLEYTAGTFGSKRHVQLPVPAAISIASVKYLDIDGMEQTFDPAEYSLKGSAFWLLAGGSWPTVGRYEDAVRVEYIAGYDEIPESIRVGALLHVGTMYKNRESVGEAQSLLPHGYHALLSTFQNIYV